MLPTLSRQKRIEVCSHDVLDRQSGAFGGSRNSRFGLFKIANSGLEISNMTILESVRFRWKLHFMVRDGLRPHHRNFTFDPRPLCRDEDTLC
jgi:hypothetical protein